MLFFVVDLPKVQLVIGTNALHLLHFVEVLDGNAAAGHGFVVPQKIL